MRLNVRESRFMLYVVHSSAVAVLCYALPFIKPNSYIECLTRLSNTLHEKMDSDKVFLLLSDQYRNPEGGFEPGTLVP